ncbi:MAG: hypothetical protein H8D23_20310 [Candidatus Brocadiales bacterium]|nr:hypothetical protein [Candidatus Brocadiales bacterium]
MTTDDFSQEKIDALLEKAYKKEEAIDKEVKNRPKEPTSDEVFQLLNTKRDETDLTKLLAFNKLVRASNVINHFVLDTELGTHVIAGVTFADGVYEHLDENIPESTVLKNIPVIGE